VYTCLASMLHSLSIPHTYATKQFTKQSWSPVIIASHAVLFSDLVNFLITFLINPLKPCGDYMYHLLQQ
jgi:hypothetical protein